MPSSADTTDTFHSSTLTYSHHKKICLQPVVRTISMKKKKTWYIHAKKCVCTTYMIVRKPVIPTCECFDYHINQYTYTRTHVISHQLKSNYFSHLSSSPSFYRFIHTHTHTIEINDIHKHEWKKSTLSFNEYLMIFCHFIIIKKKFKIFDLWSTDYQIKFHEINIPNVWNL